jgi:GAF domain-containing protein
MRLIREFFVTPRAAKYCRRLLAEVCADCRAEESTLWLVSGDGNAVMGVLNHGPTPDILEHASVPVSESLTGLVASSGIGMCLGPDDAFNRAVDEQTGTPTRGMVAAPIHFHGELAGVLTAINPIGRDRFQSKDLEQLSWRIYLLELILRDLSENQN